MKEVDPNGKSPNTAGAKLDAGKVRPALVLSGFARAILEVSKVGTFGANKYTDNGWVTVPDGIRRYDEAKLRHWLAACVGEDYDKDSGLLHAAHEAWNALAKLDLMLREREKPVDLGSVTAPSEVYIAMIPGEVYIATGDKDEGMYHFGPTGRLTKCTK